MKKDDGSQNAIIRLWVALIYRNTSPKPLKQERHLPNNLTKQRSFDALSTIETPCWTFRLLITIRFQKPNLAGRDAGPY
jgi:hypothetical protein